MSKINVRSFSNENEDGAPDLVGITTFSATSYFVPTRGTTKQRPSDHVEVGSLRYNYDIKNLEYYRGDTLGWSQFKLEEASSIASRAVFAGGQADPTPATNTIDYNQVATLGNALDFGDMTITAGVPAGAANKIRGIIAGGYAAPATSDVIQKVTIATTGNATSFGSLSTARRNRDGCADSNRALFGGGFAHTAQIDMVTIMSDGNSVDFGDITETRYNTGAVADRVRGVFAGGVSTSPAPVNIMDYVTIQSTGNAVDFGDLTDRTDDAHGHASSTRGIYVLGNGAPHTSDQNIINYITIASTGNAIDFGDSHAGDESACTGSSTRALIAGGFVSPATVNNISYIEIPTLGTSADFGDLTIPKSSMAHFSNDGGGT